jgi:hypothetical protein
MWIDFRNPTNFNNQFHAKGLKVLNEALNCFRNQGELKKEIQRK